MPLLCRAVLARLVASFLGLSACSGAFAQAAPGPAALLYWPDVHDDQVVFTAEGDLWLASLTGNTPARRLTSQPGTELRARFSPDGTMIAFNGQYDGASEVYVMPTAGGAPVRLTFDANQSSVIGWTPDGKDVLFKSRRNSNVGAPRLFAIPAKGGAPRLLPIPQVEQASINADGRRVAYVPVSADWQHWYRYRGGEADHLWLADIEAHSFKRLTDFDGIDKNPVWVGDTLYFISQRDNVPNLYRMNPVNGKATEVTHYRETAYANTGSPSPSIPFTDYEIDHLSTDGKHLIYEHGKGLAMFDPATDKTRELTFPLPSDRIHARPKRVAISGHITDAAVGPAGKRVVVTVRGQLVSLPVQEGDTRLVAPMPGSRSHSAVWSPDGKEIAFVSDRGGEEDIWIAPAQGVQNAVRQLTHRTDHGPLGRLEWSPDGAWVAVGDGEMRILLIDAKTGAITQVDQADRGGSYDSSNDFYHFSPDGKWLTYAKIETNWNDAVFLYEIATKIRTQITNDEMSAYAPAFDTEGKYLVYLSDRQFDPQGSGGSHYFAFDRTTKVTLVTLAKKTKSPYLITNDEEGAAAAAAVKAELGTDAKTPPDSAAKAEKKPETTEKPKLPTVTVDVDGLPNRIVDVPIEAGHYGKAAIVGDRLLLFDGGDPYEQGIAGSSKLLALKLNKPVSKADDSTTKPKVILDHGISDFNVSTDAKKILIMSGSAVSVIDAAADSLPPASTVDTSSQTIPVDPPAEWRQIFNEAWRIGRDFYYDPKMQGVDWQAVHAKYAALLPALGDRSDLNVILGDMIAELNTGHAYVGGGDIDSGARSIPMGYLGADLSPAPAASGGHTAYRIDRIFPGDGFELSTRSPLLEPGVDVGVGDYILAVGGQPVRADQDIQALLIGTPGQITTLTVNSKPTLDGARSVQVRPHGAGPERKMRYYAWVADERDYVAKNGGPNMGYVHIPDMESGGLTEFAKHYYSNLDKDAMVVDVRYNGGGYIDAMLLLQIGSKPYSYFKPRYGASWTRQDWAFPGYLAALCNEGSGSDAEEFSDAFQRLKIGPLIGARSWGGEVGSGGGYSLIDGGRISIPNYGEWTPDGKWVIEGTGVRPDMPIEQDPAEVLAGKDPQIDRAIAYFKAELAKHPIVHPVHPPFPNKAFVLPADK